LGRVAGASSELSGGTDEVGSTQVLVVVLGEGVLTGLSRKVPHLFERGLEAAAVGDPLLIASCVVG